MKAAASASSSCAISSSIFAQIGTARVAAPRMNVLRPAISHGVVGAAAGPLRRDSARGAAAWPTGTEIRADASHRPAPSSKRPERPPASSAARQREQDSCSLASSASLPFFRSRSSRSSRRSTTPRSARMTSSSIVRTSRAGSTEPAGCGTDGSRNMRTTCSSASALRNGATSSSAAAPGLDAGGAADVGELDGRRHVLARIEQRRQLVQALVGNARHADVGLRLAARRAALPGRWSGAGTGRSCPTTENQSEPAQHRRGVAQGPSQTDARAKPSQDYSHRSTPGTLSTCRGRSRRRRKSVSSSGL